VNQKKEAAMQTYIESFAEPTIGRKHDLGNGHEILVSARLLKRGSPYNVVTHIDPWEKQKTIGKTDSGTLLIEARDPTDLEEGTIAHCVLQLDKGSVEIVEVDVAYPYRGNHIMEALVALAWRLAGDPKDDLSEDAFKYL
jgi:hypothetical protein